MLPTQPILIRCAAGLALTLAIALPVAAQNAAIVNKKAITSAQVDEFVNALKSQGRPDTPELRAMVREELIARELFVQEAEKRGLHRQGEVKSQLDNMRTDLMIRALIRDHLKKSPITDADVQAEYAKVSAQQVVGGKEYRARHILLDKEDDAKKVIERLKKGDKFEELAKQSKDPGSAQNGGDLDWSTPATFVKEFSDAMVKLEKGKFTEAPVKSQYGFHVIRLDDTRDAKAPPMDQIKPQIQQELERRKIQDLQKDLRGKATVQ